MFPPNTSFIPVDVALARFIEANGFYGDYPFWYLGTAKVNFLTGPIVPSILIFLHTFFGASYFSLSLILVFLTFVLIPLLWGYFAKVLSGSRNVGVLTGLILLISPWHIVWGLGFGSVSGLVAFSLVPIVLVVYLKRSKFSILNFQFSNLVKVAVAFALLFLVNVEAGIVAFVGLLTLAIVLEKDWVSGIKVVFKICLLGIALTVWWYFPVYWFNLLFAPSIGGRTVVGALSQILGLSKSLVPLILAIAVVKYGLGVRDKYLKFVLIFLGVFGFLTLFRFISDFDFWLDWTAWIGEVEVGVVMFVAYKFAKIPSNRYRNTNKSEDQNIKIQNNKVSNYKNSNLFGIWSLGFVVLLLIGWFIAFRYAQSWMPRKDISGTVEYRIAKKLEEIVPFSERVFLSGTTAFWLNSLVDIPQVRGGVDQGAFDNKWREIAWSVREGSQDGEDFDDALVLLKDASVRYIVVHDETSSEFYHDFKNLSRFENNLNLEKVWEEDGDRIYKIGQ